ncbi:MAG: diacylglycerol kinase family protein [Bacillota bacterium]
MKREGRDSFRHTSVVPRFRDAFRGGWIAYREEPNLRFHLFAASCVAVAGYAVRLAPWEVAYLALTVALVIFAELVNTAVERTVDLAADGRRHPLAATAKQVAASGVLLAALHAAFAAAFLFLIERSFAATFNALLGLLAARPWPFGLPIIIGLLGLYGGARGSTD